MTSLKIAEALRVAAERLAAAGVPNPDWDAEVLLRHVLGWERATLFSRSNQSLLQTDQARFFELVSERAQRRPLQHLTGVQFFWRHEFLVTPEALIPRPETELIVEAGLSFLGGVTRPMVVDVGTGSGCIALSLAAERPDAVVHATDISESALAVARQNARRLGLFDRVSFHLGDLLAPMTFLAGSIDLIACNPPYVDPGEDLPPEVGVYDPPLALFPPGDRYSVYRRLLPQAASVMRPGGAAVVEVGFGMADEVIRICEASSLVVRHRVADLQGIPRVIVAKRS